MKKHLALGLLCILTTACTYPTTDNFNQQMQSIYGQPVDVLIPAWGAPQATYRYQDGRTVYQWHQTSSQIYDETSFYHGTGVSAFSNWPSAGARMMSYGGGGYGGYTAPIYAGNYAGQPYLFADGLPFDGNMAVNRPMVLEHHCRLVVTADNNNRIIGHQAIGDNCVAYKR